MIRKMFAFSMLNYCSIFIHLFTILTFDFDCEYQLSRHCARWNRGWEARDGGAGSGKGRNKESMLKGIGLAQMAGTRYFEFGLGMVRFEMEERGGLGLVMGFQEDDEIFYSLKKAQEVVLWSVSQVSQYPQKFPQQFNHRWQQFWPQTPLQLDRNMMKQQSHIQQHYPWPESRRRILQSAIRQLNFNSFPRTISLNFILLICGFGEFLATWESGSKSVELGLDWHEREYLSLDLCLSSWVGSYLLSRSFFVFSDELLTFMAQPCQRFQNYTKLYHLFQLNFHQLVLIYIVFANNRDGYVKNIGYYDLNIFKCFKGDFIDSDFGIAFMVNLERGGLRFIIKIMEYGLSFQYKYYNFNNKMGTLSSSSTRSQPIPFSQLKFLKMSSLGSHYKSLASPQQYLYLQTSPTINFIPFSSFLSKRSTVFSKHIPKILSFSLCQCDQSSPLSLSCSIPSQPQSQQEFIPFYQIFMVHPSRSLSQQIQQREAIQEIFQQGEVWMIIYSVLNAIMEYEILGYGVEIGQHCVFVGGNGEVVVSDVWEWANNGKNQKSEDRQNPEEKGANQWVGGGKRVEVGENFKRLIEILSKIMREYGGRKNGYSKHLLQYIDKLKSSDNHNYRKASSLLIYYKRQSVIQQGVPALTNNNSNNNNSNSNNNKQNLKQKQEMLIQKTTTSTIKKSQKQKFNKTSPLPFSQHRNSQLSMTNIYNINLIKNQQNTAAFSQRQKQKQKQKWGQLSSIDQTSQTSKQFTTTAVNRLFMQDYSCSQQKIGQNQKIYEALQTRNLSLKNKLFLQSLIMKEKNMIIEVSESDLDLSERMSMSMSMRSPSLSTNRNTLYQSKMVLNSISQLDNNLEN